MKNYAFKVYRKASTDIGDDTEYLGEYHSHAVSREKAISNIRFKNHFRDYDDYAADVSYSYIFQDIEDAAEVMREYEEALPTYKYIDRELYILTDGGTYEFVDD